MTNASIAHRAARHRHSAKGCLYDASLREQALNNISMLNQLYGAIPNNELYGLSAHRDHWPGSGR